MVRAIIAAFGPVERPVIAEVSGMSAMIRMKNGKERSTLTTKPVTWLTPLTSGEAEPSVSNSAMPSGSPSSTVRPMVTTVM